MWGTDVADSADWELSKENVQPLRQGRRVDVLNSSLQTTADEQMAQKIAEERRNFELEIRTYSGDDPLAPWHQYVLWMEQHCPRGGHEGNLDGLLTQCMARFSAETRYHQDPRFVALIIKQACSSQQPVEMFKTMFARHIGTQLTMFYRAWSAQLELAGNMTRADLVLAEGERFGAQPAVELAEARRKLQTRVASALAAGRLAMPTAAQIARSAADERRALGALKGSSDGAVTRQRIGDAQAGRPGVLPTAAPPPHHARQNHRLQVFVDENAPQPAAAPAAAAPAAELPTGRAMHKENVRKAGPWGAPQKASKRPAPGTDTTPTFSVYEDRRTGAAQGSPITDKPGALAARAAPAPATADSNFPVAHFEPHNDKVKAMYCKDVIYAGAGEVSLEELRAARWKKENRLLLEQRRMHEEVQRTMQEVLRRNEEMQRKNEQLERQLQELKARPPPLSLHGSLSSSAHLGSSNVSAGSSSLAGHSNLSGSTVLASPTVNTRDAMNYVREMLNQTVETSLQVPRHRAAETAPATVPFTVYEEPEASVSEPPPAPAATPFAVYEEPPPAPAAPAPAQKPQGAAAAFAVYEDEACGPPTEGGSGDDSDQENRPPADCPPPPPRRRPPHILVDAVDIATEPLEPPAAAAPAARRPLQFDDELTGFVPLTQDVSFAAGDLSMFAAAAGRVASTPFVPPQPPPAVGAATGRQRRDEEEGDFTASLKSVRFSRPAGGDRTSPTEGGALTPIMERSRERFKSSSSSSGSDMSRQSRCDVSAPGTCGQPWRQRPSVGADLPAGGAAHHLSVRCPPSQLTQSSGYLGDRSCSVRPASVAADCSMSRRPDPAGDVSDVQAPDVSMARPAVADPADCSALRPGDLSEKAAELSLATTAERSPAQRSAAERSAARPPAELSACQPPADLSACQPPAGLSPAQPPADLSAFQPPADLSAFQPAADLSAFQPPADLSVVQPPADLSAFQPPAELSPLQPPAGLSPAQPPADLSVAQPPADLSAFQPPAELSPVQPAAAASAALSALTLEEGSEEHPDPWDAELLAGLLRALARPVRTRQRYRRLAAKLPNFSRKEVELDGRRLTVTLIGEGAYARVYHALDRESGATHCLKVQPDGGDWEFYVVDELRERLLARDGGGAEPSFVMSVDQVAVYDNGSILCSEYERSGTLLDAHNKLTALHGKFDECLAMLFTAEMLGAVSAVHSAGVIHGDVKPDNFLLRGRELEQPAQLVDELRSSGQPQLLQLIDFGRAIDMTLLPPGTTFTRVVTTDTFTCPEMKDGRPWTYQTDLYGVAASAHVLLFGSYLKLSRRPAGDWTISGKIRRFWSPVWAEFFAAFLNIPSCSELPDLAAWRSRFLELALSGDVSGLLRKLAVAIKQR